MKGPKDAVAAEFVVVPAMLSLPLGADRQYRCSALCDEARAIQIDDLLFPLQTPFRFLLVFLSSNANEKHSD